MLAKGASAVYVAYLKFTTIPLLTPCPGINGLNVGEADTLAASLRTEGQ